MTKRSEPKVILNIYRLLFSVSIGLKNIWVQLEHHDLFKPHKTNEATLFMWRRFICYLIGVELNLSFWCRSGCWSGYRSLPRITTVHHSTPAHTGKTESSIRC